MKYFGPLVILLTGCDLFGAVRPTGKPVSEAYGGSHELRILEVGSPLLAQKKVPLLTTPEVLAIFAPSYSDKDVMYGERWLFIRVRESEWLSDRLRDPDPPATGDASPESMRPLRDMDWQRAVIPHRD
jgi:hypothetical protein